MVRPYFDRFPAKLRKRKVCIKCWKRFLTCWQSSLFVFISTLTLNHTPLKVITGLILQTFLLVCILLIKEMTAKIPSRVS